MTGFLIYLGGLLAYLLIIPRLAYKYQHILDAESRYKPDVNPRAALASVVVVLSPFWFVFGPLILWQLTITVNGNAIWNCVEATLKGITWLFVPAYRKDLKAQKEESRDSEEVLD